MLLNIMKKFDLIGRYGGDEVSIILSHKITKDYLSPNTTTKLVTIIHFKAILLRYNTVI